MRDLAAPGLINHVDNNVRVCVRLICVKSLLWKHGLEPLIT